MGILSWLKPKRRPGARCYICTGCGNYVVQSAPFPLQDRKVCAVQGFDDNDECKCKGVYECITPEQHGELVLLQWDEIKAKRDLRNFEALLLDELRSRQDTKA